MMPTVPAAPAAAPQARSALPGVVELVTGTTTRSRAKIDVSAINVTTSGLARRLARPPA
jgi:hypothetical protein